MNLNVKLDGESEEQGIQYINRFAINIPSTTFNLNIVNSGLNNQGYILNPVTSVGQNIVTYQPSMAVQSYFALPAESEGNILHSLPMGVSVPVGLPVQTGFLQNNFVNTSIIIGSENCNSQDILSCSPNHGGDEEEDLKSGCLEKPIEELLNENDGQNIELKCSPNLIFENTGKKPCPLEMSIKAANIDIEFEKCDQEIPILVENSLQFPEEKLTENSLHDSGNGTLQMSPLTTVAATLADVAPVSKCITQRKKTEITWDEETVKPNQFQESLICEVEEVNDDEGDEDEGNAKNQAKSDTKNQSDCEKAIKGSGDSSEESDGLPLSVALKLKKLPDGYRNSEWKRDKKIKGGSVLNKTEKSKKKRIRRESEVIEADENWSDSDDDVLNLKRIKNDFNYKCFFESKADKSNNLLILKSDESLLKKFSRVRSCCSKKECSKKISVRDQMAIHKQFYDLDSNGKQDLYLVNCIEHVYKGSRNSQGKLGGKEKGTENGDVLSASNIRIDIENESNGNQKLSDEIQNAINESLKDCGVKIMEESVYREENQYSDREEKNNWNYYVVIDRCKKKVCLQFLLKLLRITKNRIKQLQKKILSGTPLIEESEQVFCDVLTAAKSHLDSMCDENSPSNCLAIPRHRFLTRTYTREELYASFKEFYLEKMGKEPNMKFPAYKRFLEKETTVSFQPKTLDACLECEYLIRRKKQSKNSKNNKTMVISKKQKPDSGEEFSTKCKKLRINMSTKNVGNSYKDRNTEIQERRSCNNTGEKKRAKTKGPQKDKSRQQTPSRGRDVWSLMLLHLETMPYKECSNCMNKKKHRFLNSTFTTQGLFEDYRKYFLKETNSELGLGFTMYEKYFNRNCNYTIMDINEEETRCPRCISDQNQSKS